MTARRTKAAIIAAAAIVAVTGCSNKAVTTADDGGDSGTVETGRGIDGTTITIGSLTDLSGVFAANGKDATNAQALFWDQQNAKGGVCGTYQVKTAVQDHGYVVQNAVQLYAAMKDDVLAIEQTIGSPISIALADQLKADQMVNIPLAWARSLTENPQNAVIGATYDVEMINGLDHLLQQGAIKEGDKLGHIYFEGDYGANGLAGSKYFASKHGMTVVEAQIKSTDTDMTAQVTNFKAQGVDAILLTTAPTATASAASVAAQVGLDVPILGNNAVYAPGLLDSPAGPTLESNLLVAAPVTSFDQQPQLLSDYTAAYPDGAASLGAMDGYVAALVMDQILEKACADGDLTPEGVTKAKASLTDVDTHGLVVPLDYSKGGSPSGQSYILKPGDGPGGLQQVAPAAEGEDVAGYEAGA
jgi:ABC-type branched-subunit amino acid transport system substrate-binding protein